MAIGKKIDAAIDQLFGIEKTSQTYSESIHYTFASLTNVIAASRQKNPANPYKKIFCSGTVNETDLNSIAEQLNEHLKQLPRPDDFELLVRNNLLSSSEAMQLLSQCDAVVLFETLNHSRYEQLENEKIKLAHMGKEILGLVLIE